MRTGNATSINLFDKLQRLLTVSHDKKLTLNPVLGERVTNESDVRRIIFDEENATPFTKGLSPAVLFRLE